MTVIHRTVTTSHVNGTIVILVDVHHVNSLVVNPGRPVSIAAVHRVILPSGGADRYLQFDDNLHHSATRWPQKNFFNCSHL